MPYMILDNIFENIKEIEKYKLTKPEVIILGANAELIKKAILYKMTSVQTDLGQGKYRGNEEAIYQCIAHMVQLATEIGTDYKDAYEKFSAKESG